MNSGERSIRVIDEFEGHYRLLGITASDDLENLKRAYKKQMRQWHPDRFGHDADELREAEARAKDINFAYQAITDYHDAHGSMPVENVPTHTETFRPSFDSPSYSEPRKWNPPPRVDVQVGTSIWPRLIAVAAVIGTISFIFVGEKSDPDGDALVQSVQAPATQNVAPPIPVASDDTPKFGPGSSVSEVYAIQGVPDKVSADVWHYGDARVVFNHGRVVHWTDLSGRLKVRGSSGTTVLRTESTFFHKGSSKEEVRAVQGAPIRDSGTVWEYGMSRVYFDHNGLVVDWKESTLDPLRARR